MTALEFPLAQKWTRGLTLGFENAKESRNYDWASSFHLKQTHSNKVVEISSSSKPLDVENPIAEADGMVARGEWLKDNKYRLLIKTADCLPLFYIETETQKIAAIHAGWRGLQQKIHLWPFENGGFDPRKTWVWVGPSLNGEKFEVREDMWSQFPKSLVENPTIFVPHNSQKYFCPWKLLEQDFQKIHVELLYNVEVNTYLNREWASYRRKCHDEQSLGKNIPYSQNLSWIGV
jgi:copper oxidase (laccase) domain-containing protein